MTGLRFAGGLFVLLLAAGAAGDQLEATRDTVVRREPVAAASTVARVVAGERMELLDEGRQERGFYRVRSLDGGWEGWIFRNQVRRYAVPAVAVSAVGGGPEIDYGVYSEDCPFGCPRGALSGRALVSRGIYTLQNNGETKFADWVAYRVLRENLEGESPGRQWRADPWLPSGSTLEPGDYRGAHARLAVDRGHQAPLATFNGTGRAAETNFLSNITPQRSDLNQGRWVALESRERSFVAAGGGVLFVMTGPTYEREMEGLPEADEPHRVPSGYWKVLVAGDPARPRELRVAAFLFDQEAPRQGDYREHEVSVDEVERAAGLDLLWGLEDSLETALEAGLGGEWLWEAGEAEGLVTSGGFGGGSVGGGGGGI
jgi:endonuclease G, mitochondrial